MNWTDERVELLKKLWSEGLSASQIAAQLGGVSRNAVIGKAHRLKLSGRGKVAKPQPRARKTSAAPVPPRSRAAKAAGTAEEPVTAKPIAPEETAEEISANTIKVNFIASVIENAQIRPDYSQEKPADKSNVVSMARHLTLLQLTENTCKWPMGDPLAEDFCFCGADSAEGTPYCAHHSKVAFQPVSERRRIKV